MKRWFAKIVWNLSERFNIPLGKYAPKVFGWMIGSKPYKVLTKNDIVK